MKTILIIMISMTASVFSDVEVIGENIPCSYKVSTIKKHRECNISVYIDIDKNLYISVNDTLSGTFYIPEKKTQQFRNAIGKFLKWKDLLKKEGLDAHKKIDDIRNDLFNTKNNLYLSIFAYGKGQKSELILSFVDFKNKFRQGDIFITDKNVLKLASYCFKIDEAHKKMSERLKKTENLLK